MPKILFIEADSLLARSVAQYINFQLDIVSDIADSVEAAREKFDKSNGHYSAVILNLGLSPDNYVPFETIPTIVITCGLPTSSRQIAFATNVLDYVPDYAGYNLEYIVQLLKRGLFAASSKMLIVDDEPVSLKLMKNLLFNKGYSVVTAQNKEEALAHLKNSEEIRLMLIDGDMCEKDDFQLIPAIRKTRKKNQLSVIPLCERSKEYQRVTLLRNGASDIVDKPFIIEEFHARVMNNLQLVELLKDLTELSTRDYMTGLYNRRHFYEIGKKLYENFKRGDLQLLIALIDIDYLKTINDTYGHLAGDNAIKTVAQILTDNLRTADVVARFGGEEFCVLCPNVKINQAEKLFERIRRLVEQAKVAIEQDFISISVSIGVCTSLSDSLNGLIHSADKLLYQAKEEGRNKVIVEGM